MPDKTIHEGRNVKRIREMLGIKQDVLAFELGEDWTQTKISLLEGKETIEPKLLEEVAKALKVPVEAIKNFDEEKAVNFFNSFHDNSGAGAFFSSSNYNCTFNPLDKVVELYERMLKDRDVMMDELKKLINK